MSSTGKWQLINPPIAAEVENVQSEVRRSLDFNARWGAKVEATWPGCGIVAFDVNTGVGFKEVEGWRLTIEGARLLTGNEAHEFVPAKKTSTGKVRQFAPRQTAQTDLFSTSGEVRPEVAALSVSESSAPSAAAACECWGTGNLKCGKCGGTGRASLPGPTDGEHFAAEIRAAREQLDASFNDGGSKPARLATGPTDYEGLGRERYHDLAPHRREETIREVVEQLKAGTPEPDRRFALGFLDEHERATKAMREAAHATLTAPPAPPAVEPPPAAPTTVAPRRPSKPRRQRTATASEAR